MRYVESTSMSSAVRWSPSWGPAAVARPPCSTASPALMKSTLDRCSSTARWLHDLPDNERSDYRARKMGFVFQLYNLLPVLSAVENVEMPLLVSGVKAGEARKRSLAVLDQVGLANRVHNQPAELSGGQRQRVTIARALVNDPAIVWADEPTGDLDSETAQEIVDLMVELNRTNTQTFVLVTHSQEVGEQAHRIVRMRDGQIVDDGASPGSAVPPIEQTETAT